MKISFDECFSLLSGHRAPLAWQRRLYERWLARGELPSAIDLPTGLGKTSVILVWLIALARLMLEGRGGELPRRLVYVVDRRAIVDQATAEVEAIVANLQKPELAWMRRILGLEEGETLPVSTLRGRHVDNRRWLDDPSRPAIIVGTVDMVGSRLLFSGYGVSRAMRPVHAAGIGVDSLVVLDESHLAPVFERLLERIAADGQGGAEPRLWPERELVRPLCLLPLSATGRRRSGTFGLEREDFDDGPVARRLGAAKRMRVVLLGDPKKTMVGEAVERAWRLAFDEDGDLLPGRGRHGHPPRVIVYLESRELAEKVATELARRAKPKRRKEPPRAEVELFTGARRVFERQWAWRRLGELGLLGGRDAGVERPVFLVATSAAEVGVDLDADHMVCDLVPMERMIQRLGRLNRRGEHDASEVVLLADEKARREERRSDTLALLQLQEDDLSPAAVTRLKSDRPEAVERASTPMPLYPPLEPADVEAWAMTTLKSHTGRARVGPWLRGWVEDEPQTTLVWRAHLPWRAGEPQPRREEVERFFQAAPPHLLEQLEISASRAAKCLITRAGKRAGEGEGTDERALLILSGVGEFEEAFTLSALARLDGKKLTECLAGRMVVVDSRLGGLGEHGLMDAGATTSPTTLDDGWEERLLRESIGYRVAEVAAGTPAEAGWRRVFELPLAFDEEDEPTRLLVVEAWRADGQALESEPAIAARPYPLRAHLDEVAAEAWRIAERVGLPPQWCELFELAGWWHDHGKNRALWQLAANAPLPRRPLPAGALATEDAWAKTEGPFLPRLLGGYRHEFGSLADAEQAPRLRSLDSEARDLVLHLITAHHGHGRPSIRPVDPLAPPSTLERRAGQVALRFTRLQRRFGPWGLAWLEALLRAADRRASIAIGAEETPPIATEEQRHG